MSQPVCQFSDRLTTALSAAASATPPSFDSTNGADTAAPGPGIEHYAGFRPETHSHTSSTDFSNGFPKGNGSSASTPFGLHSHDGGATMHTHGNGGHGTWTPDEHGHTHEHLEHAGESERHLHLRMMSTSANRSLKSSQKLIQCREVRGEGHARLLWSRLEREGVHYRHWGVSAAHQPGWAGRTGADPTDG
jgi:hypothetical protein